MKDAFSIAQGGNGVFSDVKAKALDLLEESRNNRLDYQTFVSERERITAVLKGLTGVKNFKIWQVEDWLGDIEKRFQRSLLTGERGDKPPEPGTF